MEMPENIFDICPKCEIHTDARGQIIISTGYFIDLPKETYSRIMTNMVEEEESNGMA